MGLSWMYSDDEKLEKQGKSFNPSSIERLEYYLSGVADNLHDIFCGYIKNIAQISGEDIEKGVQRIAEKGVDYFKEIKNISPEGLAEIENKIAALSEGVGEPVVKDTKTAEEIKEYVLASYMNALEIYGQTVNQAKDKTRDVPNGKDFVKAVLVLSACSGHKIKMDAQEVMDALGSIAAEKYGLALDAASTKFENQSISGSEIMSGIKDIDTVVRDASVKAIEMSEAQGSDKLDYAKKYFSKAPEGAYKSSMAKISFMVEALDKAASLIDSVPRTERTKEQRGFADNCNIVKKDLLAYVKLYNKIADAVQETSFEDMSPRKIRSLDNKCNKINTANEFFPFENTLDDIGKVFTDNSENRALANEFKIMATEFRSEWDKASLGVYKWNDVGLVKSITSEEVVAILKKEGTLSMSGIDNHLKSHLERVEFMDMDKEDRDSRIVVLSAVKATVADYLNKEKATRENPYRDDTNRKPHRDTDREM